MRASYLVSTLSVAFSGALCRGTPFDDLATACAPLALRVYCHSLATGAPLNATLLESTRLLLALHNHYPASLDELDLSPLLEAHLPLCVATNTHMAYRYHNTALSLHYRLILGRARRSPPFLLLCAKDPSLQCALLRCSLTSEIYLDAASSLMDLAMLCAPTANLGESLLRLCLSDEALSCPTWRIPELLTR
eukprot:CAMPEP_0169462006 /NCGR_PEP_ID=MMETSP1042-20121227/19332_1 /TAXON_ID=464988 /ORGANISM="Hemiselmis andersenii, Strain CCMP1180" /LENGTH=191 /DNA_ID=CAMNT_0009574619 /DNA_START=27 /DNA_END=599 /DNA_ORIENTATION=-